MEKRKVGRPKIENNTKKKFIVYVDLDTYAFYKERGTGSVSRGMKAVQDAIAKITKDS
jgi:uncharacterized protein (DUF4415 family)